MWDHISESQDKLNDLLSSNQITDFLHSFNVQKLKRVVFVASGSSLNVSLIAKRFYEELAQIEVQAYTPFDFMGNSKIMTTFNRDETLLIAISQTGTSSGTVQAIKHAKELGFTVLSLTERTNTPVEKLGDFYLNFLCGIEPCNAKTKGVSNSLYLLVLLAVHFGKEKSVISTSIFQNYLDEMKASIEDIPVTIATTEKWIEEHKDWSTIQHFLIIGNGTNYGTAIEGMLKVMETLYVPASVCELGEFSHGFHRTINHNSNVITIYTEEYGQDVMKKTNDYLKEKVKRLLVLNATSQTDSSDHVINIEYRPLTASCLNISVALQVLATALPEIIGYDPNSPVNEDFTKIVNTRE